ncbi:hypothetical protein HNQ02_000435 [Flavobacterium sp. 7E]|uniref:hypothetical protein n=1 Tax=Flavobacterium sp. 7E TaxID=2735898 RepID=UPI0015705A1A|nr:hypothetical protein [Flavobacterium sp. 7E]NRS87528.1 hypothetical protein [Flavobacterium sp. 7E]
MKKTIVIILTFISTFSFSQTIKITQTYGSTNPEIQELMDFQKIYVEKFNFEYEKLSGKHWEINVSEFVDGKLKNKTQLGSTSEADFLKIRFSPFSLKLLSQIRNGNFTISANFYNFHTKTLHFKLSEKSDEDDYVVKDFFGAKIVNEYNFGDEFPLVAIITPTIHDDGSASYCEVVQSDIKPENLGSHFKIPHYFLITMKLKDK